MKTNMTVSQEVKGVYANILIDYWFKRTFADLPDSKRLLQLFLQELIPERKIVSISYAPQEHTNPNEDKKGIRVDVEVTDEDGTRFLVEMQRARQDHFYDRALYNASHCVIRQLGSGRNDFDYPAVYFIGLVDFPLHSDPDRVLYRYSVIEDTNGEMMTDKINYIFLELPNCGKAMTPEATILDNICYSLHNMEFLERRPEELRQEIFELLFEAANISKFTPEDKVKYDHDMTTERDIQNQISYAHRTGKEEGLVEGMEKGREEGRAEGKQEAARRMLSKGYPIEEITDLLDMTVEQVKAL